MCVPLECSHVLVTFSGLLAEHSSPACFGKIKTGIMSRSSNNTQAWLSFASCPSKTLLSQWLSEGAFNGTGILLLSFIVLVQPMLDKDS